MEGTKDEIWKKTCNKTVKIAMNWLINKLNTYLIKDNISIDECKITPENFAEFITLVSQNRFNSTIAQKVLDIMYRTGKDPSTITEEEDLVGSSGKQDLTAIIEKVLSQNQDAMENYKKGKTNAIMFLVGAVMKETKGKSNPHIIKQLLQDKLK